MFLSCAGIDFKTSTMVKSADLKAKNLTTESGDTIGFEKLILATGCGVRQPNPHSVIDLEICEIWREVHSIGWPSHSLHLRFALIVSA